MSQDAPNQLPGPRPSAPGPSKNVIGIFGGTFDPVHYGHLRIALDAIEMLGLAQVRLVPLSQAVHRDQPQTPGQLRLQMLEAAIAGRSDMRVDDRELRRDGPSYTVDTLRSLREELPNESLCLLVGEDAFAGFADWRAPNAILRLANIAVLQRPGHKLPDDPDLQALLAAHRVDRLDPATHGQIVICPVTQLEIASSDIRRRLGEGLNIDFLLPDSVVDLIRNHRLYR